MTRSSPADLEATQTGQAIAIERVGRVQRLQRWLQGQQWRGYGRQRQRRYTKLRVRRHGRRQQRECLAPACGHTFLELIRYAEYILGRCPKLAEIQSAE